MSSKQNCAKFGILGLVLMLTALWLFNQAAPTYSAPSENEVVKWEYSTTGLEASVLPAKLTELGNDGWDVFSIVRTDSVVEQGNDGKTHLTTSQFQVTAKRRAR